MSLNQNLFLLKRKSQRIISNTEDVRIKRSKTCLLRETNNMQQGVIDPSPEYFRALSSEKIEHCKCMNAKLSKLLERFELEMFPVDKDSFTSKPPPVLMMSINTSKLFQKRMNKAVAC